MNGVHDTRPLVVDTDILVDALRDVQEAIAQLEEIEERVTVSIVTQMELIVGCRNASELRRLERFLSRFTVRTLTGATAKRAVSLLRRYRLSHGLLIPDALIAATALADTLPLLTKNQRDFRFIDGLELLPYPLPS